jgi:hypothetical protein
VPPLIDAPSTVSNIIHWSGLRKFSYLDGASIVPSINNLISVFSHGPENVVPEIRKFPAGTWMITHYPMPEEMTGMNESYHPAWHHNLAHWDSVHLMLETEKRLVGVADIRRQNFPLSLLLWVWLLTRYWSLESMGWQCNATRISVLNLRWCLSSFARPKRSDFLTMLRALLKARLQGNHRL